jgi:hypothetical protein
LRRFDFVLDSGRLMGDRFAQRGWQQRVRQPTSESP